jgi:small subunit ribosomal protein S20
MANTKSAAKRARQTIRRTIANRKMVTAAKTKLKKARAAVLGTDKEAAAKAVARAMSQLDKAAKKNRIHKNKASRHKSQLSRALAKMGAAAAAK